MVLPLKRWKSRASPGIAAGAHDISALEEPIHNSKGGPLSFIRRMSAFFRFCPVEIQGILVKRDGAARRRFADAKRETKKASGR
jgi:hypothetical protein